MSRNGFILFLFCLGPFGLYAQYKRQKPEPVRENFCLLLDQIFAAQAQGFTGFADSLSDEGGPGDPLPVREEYTFDQASCALIELPTGETIYRAVFMTRDSKESVVASYRNLLAMVKECYSEDYVFKDKESKIRKVYECRGAPYDIDVNKDQPEVVVYISEDWINKVYQLVLQVD